MINKITWFVKSSVYLYHNGEKTHMSKEYENQSIHMRNDN